MQLSSSENRTWLLIDSENRYLASIWRGQPVFSLRQEKAMKIFNIKTANKLKKRYGLELTWG